MISKRYFLKTWLFGSILISFLHILLRTTIKTLSRKKMDDEETNGTKDFPGSQLVKNPPALQEAAVQFLGQEDLLEKG